METPSQAQDPATPQAQKLQSLKTIATVVYALQAAGFVLGGVTWIIAIIVNYVKRDDVRGTWLEPHFTWQIRTFWWGLLWGVVGVILAFVLVGFAVLFAAAIWMIYRIVKGWLALYEGKPVS